MIVLKYIKGNKRGIAWSHLKGLRFLYLWVVFEEIAVDHSGHQQYLVLRPSSSAPLES